MINYLRIKRPKKTIGSDLADTVEIIHRNLNFDGKQPVSWVISPKEIRLTDSKSERSIGVSITPRGDYKVHHDEDGFYIAVPEAGTRMYSAISDSVYKALKRK